MNKLLYLFTILLLASCSTVQKGGIIQSRTYKFKPHKTRLPKYSSAKKHRPALHNLQTKSDSVVFHQEASYAKVKPQPAFVQNHLLRNPKASAKDGIWNSNRQIKEKTIGQIHTPSRLIKTLEALHSPKPPQKEEPVTYWAAIVSLVTGILSVYIIPLGVFALVFSIIALNKINNEPHLYKGTDIAVYGLILGIITTLIMLLYLWFVLATVLV